MSENLSLPQGPDEMFFEGAEKELDVWFTAPSHYSLRDIPRAAIDDLLSRAACSVVDVSYTADVDSYVLSESSLFVFNQRLILKTCGTTTILNVLPSLLPLIREHCGSGGADVTLAGLTYSRKNMEKPDEQQGVHRDFRAEIAFLDLYVGKLGLTGAGYVMGRLNGDHWNLYALDRNLAEVEPPEECTEILMSDLDPALASLFYYSEDDPDKLMEYARKVTKMSGISELLPDDAVVNPYMFYPCGFSLNAVVGAFYWTVHVTPQPNCSYASFETNFPYEDLDRAVAKILECFHPNRFICVRFANEAAGATRPVYKRPSKHLDGFTRRDFGSTSMGQYAFAFGHYVRSQHLRNVQSAPDLLNTSMEAHQETI